MRPRGDRLLALDLGQIRIGVAVSDPLGIVAQPAGFIRRRGGREDAVNVRAAVERHGVSTIVVGYPLHLSGRRGVRAEDAEQFAALLRQALPGVAVELWDERLTTAEVERLMIGDHVPRRRRRKVVDSLAAVVILQSYMDARSSTGAEPR